MKNFTPLDYILSLYLFTGLIYAIILFYTRGKQLYRYWLTGLLNDMFMFILCLTLWPAWLIASKIKYEKARYRHKIKVQLEQEREAQRQQGHIPEKKN